MSLEDKPDISGLLDKTEIGLPNEAEIEKAVKAHHPNPTAGAINRTLDGVVHGRGGQDEVRIEQEAELDHAQQLVEDEVNRNGTVGWRRRA